jgi:hypothetical protein
MKSIFIGLLLAVFVSTVAYASIKQVDNGPIVDRDNYIARMLNGKTSTGDSDIFAVSPWARTFDAKVVGTGAVTATVIIYVSNTGDDDDWITAGTITLSGTTSDVDGFAMNAKWAYAKANVSAISGTDAAVTVTMGV